MSEHFISRDEAESDLLSCAAYLAESIESNDGRAQAMMAVVPQYLAKGEVDLAAELSNTVDDPYVRDRLLIAVAETCAGIGDDEYALQLVEAMDDHGMQAQARERIGLKLASAGGIEKARTVADDMDHSDNVLAGIAVRQHADGNASDALETVGEIEFPSAAAHALVAMAAGSVEKENLEQAVDLLDRAIAPAEETEHEEERIRSLIDIGNSFIAAKRNDRAVETFDKARGYADVLDNIHRDNFLSAVSLGFLRAGSLELADRTLDSVRDKTQIATALLGFARELWRRDEKTEASDALDEAYSILKSQKEIETRDSKARFALFVNIAVQFAGFEKGERAIGIAHEIVDENEEINALGQIANILTIQKNPELASTALNAIREDAQRTFALISLSDTSAANGDKENATAFLDEASSLAEEVPQLVSRSSAYNALAFRYFKLGDPEKAQQAADTNLATIVSIKDESSRVTAMTDLAKVFEDCGFEVAAEQKETVQSLLIPARI